MHLMSNALAGNKYIYSESLLFLIVLCCVVGDHLCCCVQSCSVYLKIDRHS